MKLQKRSKKLFTTSNFKRPKAKDILVAIIRRPLDPEYFEISYLVLKIIGLSKLQSALIVFNNSILRDQKKLVEKVTNSVDMTYTFNRSSFVT